MYEDVPIANMPNKVRVIEYQNENVRLILLKQNLRKGREIKPLCLFFCSHLKMYF